MERSGPDGVPDGVPASDFLLRIDGAEAWFRWSE